MKATLHPSILRGELAKQLPVVLLPEIKKRFETSFNKIKGQFVGEFRKHAVTQEVKGGAGASNLSGTLGGYGNLYSFFGFSGGDPIEPLLALLESIEFQFINFNRRMVASVIIKNFPTVQDIVAASPVPWAPGLSWVRGVHLGNVPNFGQYLTTTSSNSRSGGGVQVKTEISNRVFVADDSYLLGMLPRYKRKFREMQIT